MELSKGLSPIMINNDLFIILPGTRKSFFDHRTRNKESFDTQVSMENASDTRSAIQPSFALHF